LFVKYTFFQNADLFYVSYLMQFFRKDVYKRGSLGIYNAVITESFESYQHQRYICIKKFILYYSNIFFSLFEYTNRKFCLDCL